MGAYLSEPLTEKASSDETNEYLECGLSSMQGWRMTQEDAHNAVLNFDDGTSFFAVYDGHGGHEVAAYCAEHLPKFLKNMDQYKKGEVIEALKQAFLGFDNTLTKPEVISVLKELAKSTEDGQSTDDDDDDDMSNLKEEASMPIEELLAKYHSEGGLGGLKKLKDGSIPPSPALKPKRGTSSAAGCSSSSDGPSASSSGSGSGCSSSSASADQVSSSSARASNSNEVNSSDDVPDTQTNSPSPDVGSSGDVKIKDDKDVGSSGDVGVKSEKAAEVVKEEAVVSSGSSSCNGSSQNGAVDSTEKKEVNGEVNHEIKKEESDSCSKTDAVSSSSPSKDSCTNGEVSPKQEVRVKGKGKAKDKSPRPDPEAEEESLKRPKMQRPTRVSTLQMYRNLIKASKIINDDSDDDSEDEDDTTFDAGADDSDEDVDEAAEDEEEDESEDEEEESMDEEEDEEEDEDCEEFGMGGMKEEPGADSGCTAVVALLKGRDLYVANAGDSRCVVCRNGTAIEMSLDHKPEDPLEWQRILNAGGKVTCDGRVNGGLNLSRAIGDHAYKQNKEKSDTEQMITALPDVRTLRINPDEDEFMVLACDGIWNYLSSQEVVDFVRKRIQDGKLIVSQICEELFDHCLAPNTLGDGTGCDNMTAVIVKFRPELSKLPVTLTSDSVFENPVKNEKADPASEAEGKCKVKAEVDGIKEESKEVPSDEVSTSNSAKRAATEIDGSNGAEHEQPEKKIKKESEDTAASSSLDSEAVAVQV